MSSRECRQGNYNCKRRRAADGGPAQCVGEWSIEKHDLIRRYIEITANPRKKYLPPRGTGGAAFVDLFAGPGYAVVKCGEKVHSGSPMLALEHSVAPFSNVILCETDPENVEALKVRTRNIGRARVIEGDCNEKIDEILSAIPEQALTLVLIDPYNASQLRFETLARFGERRRCDLIVHYPTVDIARSMTRRLNDKLDEFFGGNEWRGQGNPVGSQERAVLLINHLREKLQPYGFQSKNVRDIPILFNRKALYHVAFASQHPIADSFWNSSNKRDPDGSGRLF